MAKMITKTQRFEDVRAYLMNENIPNGSSVQDMVSFIDKELGLLANKKNNRKQSATQVENEGYKTEIIQYLGTVTGATCTDMIKNISSMREAMLTNQRVSAICRLMVEEGTITKAMIKGQAIFSLVK